MFCYLKLLVLIINAISMTRSLWYAIPKLAWVGLYSRWGSIISLSALDWGCIRNLKGWGCNQEWGSIWVDTDQLARPSAFVHLMSVQRFFKTKKTGEVLNQFQSPIGRNLRYLSKNGVLKIFERVNTPGQFSTSWSNALKLNSSISLH